MSAFAEAGGPFFDELAIGDVFDTAPATTLTEGLAAAHRALVGGRLVLTIDALLSCTVTGGKTPLAPPNLAWDIAIGQSTLVTQRVIANLFYRGLCFHKAPAIGDTLSTTTRVVGLKPLTPRPDRPPRGLAVLHMLTVDQDGETVLDFHRCAMLPARGPGATEPLGLVEIPERDIADADLERATGAWELSPLRRYGRQRAFADLVPGTQIEIAGGDVVSSAPELARLTLNVAAVHHDRLVAPGGERLVYGGHTIDLALAQLTRAFPALATIVAWQGCDHLAPVHEGDTLMTSVTLERLEPRVKGGGFVHFRCRVAAIDGRSQRTDVLDWRPVGLLP